MKSNRNRAFLKNTPYSESPNHFAVMPILHNIIFIAVIIAGYWFAYTHYLIPDSINYLYWAVNVLVTYNIIIEAARSFLSPILTLITAAVVYFSPVKYIVLTTYEFYQLVIVGIVALLISIIIKL
jgi:hypothetical protein